MQPFGGNVMPSPFPGMDPYLEGREWISVHTELSSEIARQLVPKLRPKYTVRTTRRFFNESGDGYHVKKQHGTVKESFAPLQRAAAMFAHAPYVTIEIRSVLKRNIITIIDLLAPTNKRGEGRKQYLQRRQWILSSSIHLIEIDLLRKGDRLPAPLW